MVSTRRPGQAERVASNAPQAAGGCIFAAAPNAATSAAAIVHQVSMHRNITPLRVIRSSRASNRASIGFMTIVRRNSSKARSYPLLTRTRRISRCPDRPERCPPTGKRCFTNRGRAGFNCGMAPSTARDHERRSARVFRCQGGAALSAAEWKSDSLPIGQPKRSILT
jgi:hypothetical protein